MDLRLTAPLFTTPPGDTSEPQSWDEPWFEHTLPEVITISTFKYVIIVLGLLGNGRLIYVIWKEKKFHTVGYSFMLQLAISDILTTVCLTVVLTVSLIAFFQPSKTFRYTDMQFLGAFYLFGYYSSLFTMITISVNRLCSVQFFYKYKKLFSVRRAIIIIAFIYIGAVFFSFAAIPNTRLFNMLYFPKRWVFAMDRLYGGGLLNKQIYAVIIIIALSSALLMTVCYILIIRKLRSTRKAIAGASNSNVSNEGPKKDDVLLSIQFGVITGIFVLKLIFQIYVNNMNKETDPTLTKVMIVAKTVAKVLTFNINPYIHVLLNKRLRHHLLPGHSQGVHDQGGQSTERTVSTIQPNVPVPAD